MKFRLVVMDCTEGHHDFHDGGNVPMSKKPTHICVGFGIRSCRVETYQIPFITSMIACVLITI